MLDPCQNFLDDIASRYTLRFGLKIQSKAMSQHGWCHCHNISLSHHRTAQQCGSSFGSQH